MNDKLKRRLAGAGLLLVVAFVVVSLLPTPEQAARQAGVELVTIPLHDVISAQPPLQPTPSTTLPQTLAAPDDSASTAAAADANDGNHDDEGVDAQDLNSSSGDDDAGDGATAPASKPVTLAMSPALQHQSDPAESAPAPKPAPKPAPVESTKPEPAPAKPTPPPVAHPSVATKPNEDHAPSAPAVSGQKWFVQAGGFADIDNARKVQAKLQGIGQPTVLAPIDTAKGTIYRVRAGPYASQTAAQQAFDRITAIGFTGSQLISP